LRPDRAGIQTATESNRFRQLHDSPGPFASVYFDDSHDTHDAAAQLDLKWRALREQLEQRGADESVTDEIGQAVAALRAPIGRSGRAVVASRGVVLNEHLLRPTAETAVRVSELPYISRSSNSASITRPIFWWWWITHSRLDTSAIPGLCSIPFSSNSVIRVCMGGTRSQSQPGYRDASQEHHPGDAARQVVRGVHGDPFVCCGALGYCRPLRNSWVGLAITIPVTVRVISAKRCIGAFVMLPRVGYW
jgi:hypothetical protein